MKDPDHLVKVEKAIEEKYGTETIQNPKLNWNDIKEKEYLQQIRYISNRQKPKEKIEVNGVLLPTKLFKNDSKNTCLSCNVYIKSVRDEMYMTKFNCCWHCYIKYVEGREEQWDKRMKKEKACLKKS
tara:strand:+ start:7065 stop:7445 length:381 start_codon:yes stop_codon:yes gene_type:complete